MLSLLARARTVASGVSWMARTLQAGSLSIGVLSSMARRVRSRTGAGLVGGAMGMEKVLVEDAVIDEEAIKGGDVAFLELVAPVFEEGGDVPAGFPEEGGVAQRGVAVADEDEVV